MYIYFLFFFLIFELGTFKFGRWRSWWRAYMLFLQQFVLAQFDQFISFKKYIHSDVLK